MRRGMIALAVVASVLWQSGAYAEPDWNAVIRSELQRLNATANLTARSTAVPRRSSPNVTQMIATARLHWNALSLDTQSQVHPWLLRPTDNCIPGSSNCGIAEEPAYMYQPGTESISDTTHFRVHYVTTGSNAATPTYVNTVKQVLEAVWDHEIGVLGYTEPPSDLAAGTGKNGGNETYDVYLTNTGSDGIYGYVAWENLSSESARPNGAYSYMVLDNDFSVSEFGSADTSLPLKVTVAHEFFHAIQDGYSVYQAPTFMEETAVWMEDVVYPDIHDNYQYIGDPYVDTNGNGQFNTGEPYTDQNSNGSRDEGSTEFPEITLDEYDDQTMRYGRFLWIHYLTQNFGTEFIKSVWELCAEHASNYVYTAVDTLLRNNGSSLAQAYQDYATWGYDHDKFTDGANYPLVWVDRTQSGTNVSISSADSPSLVDLRKSGRNPQEHLSTIYTQILNPSGAYTFSSQGAAAALTVLVNTGNGILRHDVVALNNGGGVWNAPVGAVKAIAVISNVSTTSKADGMSWKFVSGLSPAKKKSGGGVIDLVFPLLLLWGFRRRCIYQAL